MTRTHSRNFFLHVLLAPLVILMFDRIFFVTQWYRFGLDNPMHVAGGAAIAWAVAYLMATSKISVPFWFRVLAIIGITMIAAIAWEWQEFLRDFFVYHAHLLQPSEADTMKDLFNGMLGATLVALITKNRYTRVG